MQEWSVETHAQAAQKAVAEQVEGMLLCSLPDAAAPYCPTRAAFTCIVLEMPQAARIVFSMSWRAMRSPSKRLQSSGVRRAGVPKSPLIGYQFSPGMQLDLYSPADCHGLLSSGQCIPYLKDSSLSGCPAVGAARLREEHWTCRSSTSSDLGASQWGSWTDRRLKQSWAPCRLGNSQLSLVRQGGTRPVRRLAMHCNASMQHHRDPGWLAQRKKMRWMDSHRAWSAECRYFVRYNREGGGQGNEGFEQQCQTVAKLFRAMVPHLRSRRLAFIASFPSNRLLRRPSLGLIAPCLKCNPQG